MSLTARVPVAIAAALTVLLLGCSSAPPSTTPRPVARLSLIGVSPDPSAVTADTREVTFFVNYAISDYDESLAPYTVSIQLDRHDGFTIGPAFGPSNAVVSMASGQVQLIVSVKELRAFISSDDLVLPLTAHVIVDHATKDGTRIVGKSEPIRFPHLGGA